MSATLELEKRIEGFLRTFENDCKGCLYTSYCESCRAKIAKKLLEELTKANGTDKGNYTTASLCARMSCITQQIKAAGRALLSREIAIGNCSHSLKEWTINRMVGAGMLVKTKIGKWQYSYSLPLEKDDL